MYIAGCLGRDCARYVVRMARTFRPLSQVELISVVAQGARRASPAKPNSCTQRAFDAVRERQDESDSHVPTARQICVRLNANRVQPRTWPEWVAIALDESASMRQVAGRCRTDRHAGAPSAEGMGFAIRWVASRIEEVPSAVGYDGAREEMRERIPKRLRHVLPTAAQIMHVTGTWEAALEIAGFEPREPDRAGGGVSAAEMVEAFVRANGAWPTKRALEQFGQDARVRWRRPHQDGVALRDVVAAVHRDMEVRGEEPPPINVRWQAHRGRPHFDPSARELATAPRAADVWTIEAATDAVARWLRARRGREVTWRAYIADAAGGRELPQGSTITRLGGWACVRAQAQQRA